MVVSLLLYILRLTSLFSVIVWLYFGLPQYVIISIILFLIIELIFGAWFHHRCNKYISLNKNIVKISNYIKKAENKVGYIAFKSYDGVYLCENNNKKCNDNDIIFNLKGFLLKKSFIRAFVVRQIRYKTVSGKLKIAKLFNIRLKCNLNLEKLYLIIDNHQYLVYSKGVSRNSFLSSEISRSKYAPIYNHRNVFKAIRNIEEVNEKIYLSKYEHKLFSTKKKNYHW